MTAWVPLEVSKRKAKDLQTDLDAAVQWFKATYPATFEDEKFVGADMRIKRAVQETFAANFAGGRPLVRQLFALGRTIGRREL